MFFFIHIDASSFAEFEISEFEISRVDCNKDTSSKALSLHTLIEVKYGGHLGSIKTKYYGLYMVNNSLSLDLT